MNRTSLTGLQVKQEGMSSAKIMSDKPDITYKLQGGGEVKLSTYTARDDSDGTYPLRGESGGQLVN